MQCNTAPYIIGHGKHRPCKNRAETVHSWLTKQKSHEIFRFAASTVDIPNHWNPRAKQSRTVALLAALCAATLFESLPSCRQKEKPEHECVLVFLGAMEGTRTPGLLIRSQSLYPAELPTHMFRSEHDVFYHCAEVLSTGFLKFFRLFRKRTSFPGFAVDLPAKSRREQGRTAQNSRGFCLRLLPGGAPGRGRHRPVRGNPALLRHKSATTAFFMAFRISLLAFLCYNDGTISLKKGPRRNTEAPFSVQRDHTEGKSYETGKRGNS